MKIRNLIMLGALFTVTILSFIGLRSSGDTTAHNTISSNVDFSKFQPGEAECYGAYWSFINGCDENHETCLNYCESFYPPGIERQQCIAFCEEARDNCADCAGACLYNCITKQHNPLPINCNCSGFPN